MKISISITYDTEDNMVSVICDGIETTEEAYGSDDVGEIVANCIDAVAPAYVR